MDVHVASALAQSLHLLSLHEHKSKELELLLPLDPVLEPELLDEAPMPELDDAPVPELDDAPVLEDAPVPELDDAPVLEPAPELLLPPTIVPEELLLLVTVSPPALLVLPPSVDSVDALSPFPLEDSPPD